MKYNIKGSKISSVVAFFLLISKTGGVGINLKNPHIVSVNRSLKELTDYESFDFTCYIGKEPTIFWLENKHKFPNIFNIFKEISIIPAFSSDIERSFSCAGNLISKKRNRLKAEFIR